jgi:hypothetical protein
MIIDRLLSFLQINTLIHLTVIALILTRKLKLQTILGNFRFLH